MKTILMYGFVTYCLINLARITAYLVSSDIYSLKQARKQKPLRFRYHLPTISILVPAYNEARAISRCLESLYELDYPTKKLEVIVINDGSTDNTREIVTDFIKQRRDRFKFRLLNRPNQGKAHALNYALKQSSKGSLIMCLDADSYLDKKAIRNAAQYFRNRQVVALSANVNVIEDGTVLALAQRIEYLMGYHMKKGQQMLGIDYIIGGMGSMFRYSLFKHVGFYDTNTMTEDIDLTFKILARKRRQQQIIYGTDVIAYTEAVHSLASLRQQRFRWKYGRIQTFAKNFSMFFARNPRYTKAITWFMMPFVVLQDIIFSFEPFIVGYFIITAARFHDASAYAAAAIFLICYIGFNIWSSNHLSLRERLRLFYYAPPMFFLIQVLAFADYYALVKSVILLPKLRQSLRTKTFVWQSPERKASSVGV